MIGGRGTGKTTVIELIRYALSLMPDEGTSGRARALKTMVQHNLSSGRIRLGVQTKHGMRYFAERAWNESLRITNEVGEPTAISFERDLIFSADVYSQNEIEEIATNPTLQLGLIDKFADEDVRRIETDLRKVQRELEQNAAEMVRLDHEIEDLEEACSELPALSERLKTLELAGADAKAVNDAHASRSLREKERKAFDALRADFASIPTEIGSLSESLVRRLRGRIDSEMLEGPSKDVFVAAAAAVDGVTRLLERVAEEIAAKADAADRAIARHDSALAERHAKQDAAYRDLLDKLEEQTGKATERVQVQSRRDEVIEASKNLELYDGEWKDSSGLSTGQRCTTILPILLEESERPLLVDQPEDNLDNRSRDNLDNRFIYETVVRNLKNAKGKRQLIFVTHNPNIPVLGDAERVFKLASTGKQGTLSSVGTVDELKHDIEELLEGGREAFLLRKERYGH